MGLLNIFQGNQTLAEVGRGDEGSISSSGLIFCCHGKQIQYLQFPQSHRGTLQVTSHLKLKLVCSGIFCPAGRTNFIH